MDEADEEELPKKAIAYLAWKTLEEGIKFDNRDHSQIDGSTETATLEKCTRGVSRNDFTRKNSVP